MLRTVSESSKQLVVIEQITTSKLRQTNSRSQLEETSVQKTEMAKELETVSSMKELEQL